MFALTASALVLVWASWSRKPLSEFGLVRPASWARAVTFGLLIGIAFKFNMKALVMPLLGADPTNPVYDYIAGNAASLAGMLFIIVAGGGFGEELFWRGFLFDRSRALLGPGAAARAATLVATSLLFGLAHYSDQGVAGVEQAIITGLVFGALFIATGSLAMPMIAHAAFDVTALLLIYWNLETGVARFIFK